MVTNISTVGPDKATQMADFSNQTANIHNQIADKPAARDLGKQNYQENALPPQAPGKRKHRGFGGCVVSAYGGN